MIFLIIVYLASVLGNVLILVACKNNKVQAERFEIRTGRDAKAYFGISCTPVLGTICFVLAGFFYVCNYLSEFKH